MIKDRDRLIELLMQGELEAEKQGAFNCSRSKRKAEIIADFLLENGVKVQPVKIGTTVYELRRKAIINGRRKDSSIATQRLLEDAVRNEHNIYISAKAYAKTDSVRLGSTIFVTVEEAVEKLRSLGIENPVKFI